ncbi:hypothetical protein FIM10_01870 [Sphingomonadales bacterium 56]|uniref:hypothetical protein n=1 Tax=unclassified Sphingobium TaxID=2611147 RepID=UPI00191A50A0|nr:MULTISPECIES: hypothetical protein [unclassified Sphingobium]MBY2927431.1 hypothetical protein [Sphingomonadales bacterium 56]MBY2957499.1 hypothetical protein [Sphingomonadales bacterium 58]MBY2957542.1 hypothetical protein [Sphingomonadales bacterium 58]CAD7335177.1 hypothetical protein SPHS8_00376 [Sphingobium sp. S8]CAD7335196.1 hypothetical protein SPHS6_00376 [Sphingobium sp. S6]
MTTARRLSSPGPIADAFMRSRAFIKIIIGPVGSGKTMAALQCGLRVAALQKPSPGPKGVMVRKARIGVLRESYPSLKSTTLKSWFNVVPEGEGNFLWSAPYTHHFQKITRRAADGAVLEIVDIEYEFRAIGDQTVEEACRGWEINAVIVDEADLQPADLVPYLTGRVGRFSNLDPDSVVDPQIILSMNMPDVENHAYELAMERSLEGLTAEDVDLLEATLAGRPLVETFIQPGGMEPDAENLHNLPNGRGYYVLQIAANRHKPGYVDRMVHNKPVALMHGMPVNAEFRHTLHVRPTEWIRRRKLIVGIDQGLFAAAAILQRNEYNQIRTHREVVNLDRQKKGKLLKVGPTAFGKKLRAVLLEEFPGITREDVRLVGDPAMFAADDREDNEMDWALACASAIGFGPIRRAKSNRQALRNEAIWKAQAERDGYYIDPSCRHLIKAHSGGYRYQKQDLKTGETKGHLEIADTIYTHVADAEQYAALEGDHVVTSIRGREPRGEGRRVVNDSDFDVLRGF